MTGPTPEATTDGWADLIAPPRTPPVFNHGVRRYLFARRVADRLGLSALVDVTGYHADIHQHVEIRATATYPDAS
ncbi:hypothetical protein [Actinomadura violacea]|uniref:Uncharacterized protein n=1 Tax=Actinomadura violacea TaxID=2819934 RepID=A0ABS3S5P4_9ACTN|nr:hypothetical protein [Actinomadura violacea]MBO2463599.1 hypothetical protein [Actinomadura violacea]